MGEAGRNVIACTRPPSYGKWREVHQTLRYHVFGVLAQDANDLVTGIVVVALVVQALSHEP